MFFQIDFVAHVAKPAERETFLRSSLPDITHHIGKYRFPLTTSHRASLYLAHYPENTESGPHSGPVKGLTFLHVGSDEAVNVTPFVGSCTSIEFSGHLSSANGVFEIIRQLHRLENLTITIGSLQQRYYPEDYRIPETCPTVKTFKISLDKSFFQTFQHADCFTGCNSEIECEVAAGKCLSRMQKSLINLAESLLIRAIRSFPNLKNFAWDFPENEDLREGVQSLIQSCPRLQNRVQARMPSIPEDAEGNMDFTMPSNVGWIGSLRGSESRFLEPFETSDWNSETSQARSLPIDEGDLQQLFRPQQTPSPPPSGSSSVSVVPLYEGQDCTKRGTNINVETLLESFNLLPEQDAHERVRHWLHFIEMLRFFRTHLVKYD